MTCGEVAALRAEPGALSSATDPCRAEGDWYNSSAGKTGHAFGFATASNMGVLGSGWLIASIVLTALAAAVLGLLILPGQETILAGLDAPDAQPAASRVTARLAMFTGLFNLLWATVTVLMIVRPGSTTGA